MNATRALGLLQGLRTPAVTTSDVAALLRLSIEAAGKTMRRLEEAGLIWRIRKGLWALHAPTEPLALAEYVTAPYPCYVSLQSALYLHGMITQVPSVIYLVSLSRSHRVKTSAGVFSMHRIAPEFFGGFEVLPGSVIKIATPEKALLDILYLSGTANRLFASLPELELPSKFRRRYAKEWINRVSSARLRAQVSHRYARVVGADTLARDAVR